MYKNNKAIIAANEDFINLNLNMLNRHGIITGATGTGKTVTLKVIAETLSMAGIPSIITDVKGDLTGCAKEGVLNENIAKRIQDLNLGEFNLIKFPVRFWDVFGVSGHPIRISISDMGPNLLARILGLSEAGEGILNIVFKIADDEGLELIDLKDLKSMLQYISNHASEYQMQYGNISSSSVSTIIRKLLILEDNELFFGEPKLNIQDLMCVGEESRRGYLNIIEVNKLIQNPTLYAMFLIWLLSSFYELLPEVGDLDKPKAVLFLDEAHLIFSESNSEIIKKLTQIMKLIRSKGIGVFFISQSISDIPDEILNQLGNRVQHCLHAYTPSEIKAVKAASDSFRANPNFSTSEAILSLKTGEALISFIDSNGTPSVVQKASILPPQSYIGEISKNELDDIIKNSVMELKYREFNDRESAYEKISKINDEMSKQKQEELNLKIKEKEEKEKQKQQEKMLKEKEKQNKKIEKGITKSINKVTNSAMSSIGRQIGNAIIRGILGTKK